MRAKLVALASVVLLVAAAAVLAVGGSASAASTAGHLSGGGTATISQVAMNVTLSGDGSASGQFECLMAGRSGFVLGAFGLEHNMIVHATPTSGAVAGSVITFAGPGRLTMDGTTKMAIHVHVWVDVATQQFQLVVDEVGAMPVEQMLTGQLAFG
jgi:hypothetical protein